MPTDEQNAPMRTEDVKQAVMDRLAQNTPTEAPTDAQTDATATEQPANEQPTETPVENEQPTTEQPTDSVPIDQANQALDAAEQYKAQAQQGMQQQQQLAQENEQLKQQIEQMNKLLREQSANATQQLVDAAQDKTPMLDINELMYMSPEDAQAAMTQYNEAIEQRAANRVMQSPELQALLEDNKKANQERELLQIISDLSKNEYLKGYDVKAALPNMMEVMKSNEYFNNDNMSTEDKVFDAMVYAEGVEAMKRKMSDSYFNEDEMADYIKAHPTFQQRIQSGIVNQLKNNQQVPQQSQSTGFASVASNIPNKPQRVEDVKQTILQRLLGR